MELDVESLVDCIMEYLEPGTLVFVKLPEEVLNVEEEKSDEDKLKELEEELTETVYSDFEYDLIASAGGFGGGGINNAIDAILMDNPAQS